MTTALVIYQRALDAVSAAVLAGDFAAYRAMIDLPYLIRARDGDSLLRKATDLLPAFRTVSAGLRRRGVTHYERVAREARFLGPDRIGGRHFTHMIAGGDRIVAPHAASAVIARHGPGLWRFTEAQYPHLAHWPPTDAELFEPAPTPDRVAAGADGDPFA